MRVLRQKPQHFHQRRRQVALRPDLPCKFRQLLDIRKLAVEQQTSDLLEARLRGHFVNIVTAICQPGIRIHPANLCFACDHAGQARAISWFGFSAHPVCSFLTRETETFNHRRTGQAAQRATFAQSTLGGSCAPPRDVKTSAASPPFLASSKGLLDPPSLASSP